MTSKRNSFETILSSTIRLCLLGVVFFLFLLSVFGSVYVDVAEREYFVRDSMFLNMALIAGVLGVLFGGMKYKRKKGITLPKIKNSVLVLLTFLYIVLMFFYILMLQVQPDADQLNCVSAAESILGHNYDMWQKGGYMEYHPHQWGFVWYLVLLFRLFGTEKALAPQFVNVIALVCSAYYLSKTVGVIWKNKKLEGYLYLVLLFFAPVNGFVVYVYGIIPGLAMAIIGCFYITRMLLDNGSVADGVKGVCFLVLGNCIKSNYLIFFLVVVVFLLLDILLNKNKKAGITLAIGVAVFLAANTGIVGLTTSVTGYPKEGIPLKSYLLMGLQESPLGYGMYNGIHISIYTANDYDKQKAAEMTDMLLKEQIQLLCSKPSNTIRFFARKIAGQWNEASFENFWISGYRLTYVRRPEWLKFFLCDGYTGNRWLLNAMGIGLSLLWIGLLSYMGRKEKERPIGTWMLPCIFLAGFLYHLLFEVKPQYVLPYIYIIIPFAVCGIFSLIRDFTDLLERSKGNHTNIKGKKRIGICLAVVSIMLLIQCTSIGDEIIQISYREEKYYAYETGIRKAIEENTLNQFFAELVNEINSGE